MAAEINTPTLAGDLMRIHKVITRGLATGIEQAGRFKQAGFSEPTLQQGFCDYTHSLATVLGGHHQAEDQVAFPAFQEKLPQAPYEYLAEQHKQIESLLVAIHQDVDDVNESNGDGMDRLLKDLNAIAEIWAPHIRMEESIFSQEALDGVMSLDEQKGLSAQMGKYGKEHSNPPHLIIPFVLFNLDGTDRSAYLANMPASVMDELVMKAWKGQWASMKPFLLE